jgi:hypothetical protein
MFRAPVNWPKNDYRVNPKAGPRNQNPKFPVNIASANYMRVPAILQEDTISQYESLQFSNSTNSGFEGLDVCSGCEVIMDENGSKYVVLVEDTKQDTPEHVASVLVINEQSATATAAQAASIVRRQVALETKPAAQ